MQVCDTAGRLCVLLCSLCIRERSYFVCKIRFLSHHLRNDLSLHIVGSLIQFYFPYTIQSQTRAQNGPELPEKRTALKSAWLTICYKYNILLGTKAKTTTPHSIQSASHSTTYCSRYCNGPQQPHNLLPTQSFLF